MIINNRFKMKPTPQEEAFGRLSEEGMLNAMLEVQGIIADVDQDTPLTLNLLGVHCLDQSILEYGCSTLNGVCCHLLEYWILGSNFFMPGWLI